MNGVDPDSLLRWAAGKLGELQSREAMQPVLEDLFEVLNPEFQDLAGSPIQRVAGKASPSPTSAGVKLN